MLGSHYFLLRVRSTVELERIKWGCFESFYIGTGTHRREKSLQKILISFWCIQRSSKADGSNMIGSHYFLLRVRSTVELERIEWGWFESFYIGTHRREKSLRKKYIFYISFKKFFDVSKEVRKQIAGSHYFLLRVRSTVEFERIKWGRLEFFLHRYPSTEKFLRKKYFFLYQFR